MILHNGKQWKTLSDGFYHNGKKIVAVYRGGKKYYPDRGWDADGIVEDAVQLCWIYNRGDGSRRPYYKLNPGPAIAVCVYAEWPNGGGYTGPLLLSPDPAAVVIGADAFIYGGVWRYNRWKAYAYPGGPVSYNGFDWYYTWCDIWMAGSFPSSQMINCTALTGTTYAAASCPVSDFSPYPDTPDEAMGSTGVSALTPESVAAILAAMHVRGG